MLRLCRWGWIFAKLGTWLSQSDFVRSWLRLQSPVDCISHPYHVYTKCFSTLVCCGWAHVCTLTLLHLCRWGCILGKLGAWLSPSSIARLSTSRDSLEATGCRHRASACNVLPQQPPWLTNSNKIH